MIIPIEPGGEAGSAKTLESGRPPETGFAIVVPVPTVSPRERFERRAQEIARAAELHVRRMIDAESRLLFGSEAASEGPGGWTVEAERRDTVPFGLKRRVVLRVPVFSKPEPESSEVPSSEDPGRGGVEPPLPPDRELRRVRALMARLALDLIAQVIEINRYFAETGLVKGPEEASQERGGVSEGNTMSGGSDGFSLRRRP